MLAKPTKMRARSHRQLMQMRFNVLKTLSLVLQNLRSSNLDSLHLHAIHLKKKWCTASLCTPFGLFMDMNGASPSSETPLNMNGGLAALFSAIEHVEGQDQGVEAIPQASFQGRFRVTSRPTTPPPVPSTKRPASQSPQKPPPKHGGGRGRGRGRGSKSSGTTTHAKTSTAKTPKVEVPADPPNDDIFTSGRWTAAEQTALFTHLFGSDSDDVHAKWLKNKDRVYKKYLEANPLVAERFTASSVANKVTASITMYSYIREYEEFTGGGGDANLQAMIPESDEWHKQRLILAKRGGKSIGSLTVKKYREWKENGWYNIFEERFGRSSKVDRPVIRNSVALISPIHDEIDDIHWPPTPSRKSPIGSIHSDSEIDMSESIALKTPAPKAGPGDNKNIGEEENLHGINRYLWSSQYIF
ncbi:hypothetical protein BT96DRAFT_968810 [Gymnopus androsaceus JB14]|uniref:Uncharacterized protein n=1 Tax=Gymnopus androsaceus JB14 TaxID=1447944 RepID=A0A6A4ILF2_9AGAR|nr:hypothetical protein BT96DRAFT_968810 [Gymnopus androsaceus JB14]